VSKGETEAMYKVRWVGYGKAGDTWEPRLANLLQTDALREFERGDVDETEIHAVRAPSRASAGVTKCQCQL